MSAHPIPPRALDVHQAILGSTGSGKSYTARGLVERLLADNRRLAVIDPTGAWYGIRLAADNSGPSPFPVVVFGGPHGDVPISDRSGAKVGRILAERHLPAIVDLSEMSKAAQRRFVTGFATAVYDGHRDRTPFHLVIDEADLFVPQRVSGELATLVGAIDDIVRRGRIFGFRVTLITQRAAVINKDVLSQIGLLVAMQSIGPQDRRAMETWFAGAGDASRAREVFDSLATLDRGEGWVLAPKLDLIERVRFPSNATFDSSATPEFGTALAEPVALEALDLADLVDALEDDVAPAAKAGPAPADLKPILTRLDTIERQLAAMSESLALFGRAAIAVDHATATVRELVVSARAATGR
ncbi:MAG: DUF87 domain-containing protein [Sphingomonadaceae bacterium]|nr:DUF87 domain-containing protein [Sphingomonadaceae bacterium]